MKDIYDMQIGESFYLKETVAVISARTGRPCEFDEERIDINDLIIEELEKVKAEVTDWYMEKFHTSENVIDIIDRHINELKLEQVDKGNNFREKLRLSETEGNFLDTGITQGIV